MKIIKGGMGEREFRKEREGTCKGGRYENY